MISTKCFFMRKRIEAMRDKFKKGQLLDRDDFEVAGFNASDANRVILILKKQYKLDILVICRGKALIGWILADEVL